MGNGMYSANRAYRWMIAAGVCGMMTVAGGTGVRTAGAVNLLANGDFEAGNSGFTSGYTFSASGLNPASYTVDTDPLHFNQFASSFGDHTTGTGKMMILNGATTSNVVAWQEIVPVTPGSTYHFSVWAASWGQIFDHTDPSPAVLSVLINDVTLVSNVTMIADDGQWKELSGDWNSLSATTATIKIVDSNTASQGNDFALDDVTFAPEPGTLTLVSVGVAGLLMRTRRVIDN